MLCADQSPVVDGPLACQSSVKSDPSRLFSAKILSPWSLPRPASPKSADRIKFCAPWAAGCFADMNGLGMCRSPSESTESPRLASVACSHCSNRFISSITGVSSTRTLLMA